MNKSTNKVLVFFSKYGEKLKDLTVFICTVKSIQFADLASTKENSRSKFLNIYN